MEKLKSLIKKYPAIDVGIVMGSSFAIYVAFGDTVIGDAIIQAGWCAIEDSICLLKYYVYIILAILLISILVQLSWGGIKKLIQIKKNFQREKEADFSPSVYKKGNLYFLKFSCPKNVLFYANITYSLSYFKVPLDKIKKNSKNKFQYVIDSTINTIKTSPWYIFPSVKVNKRKSDELPLFRIDSKQQVFYLFRKDKKKPMRDFKEEVIKLEEMVFECGQHNFEIKILAKGFLGSEFSQKFLYLMK